MGKKEFMLKAIELAKKGKGRVHPNPLVGCVVVKSGKIVGTGFHKQFGGEHAEVIALKKAGRKAKGSVMFVSLEPCNFFGKTPPCTAAIVSAGVKKVFVGMLDPNPKVKGKGVRELRKKGIEVGVGLCKEGALELNADYVKFVGEGVPFVLLKIALTEDGFISWGDGRRKRVSCKESLERVQELRNEFDAVLVGINTIKKDDSRLSCRVRDGRDPIRVLLDPELEIGLGKNFLKGKVRKIIFCGRGVGKERKKGKLSEFGVDVVEVKGKNGLLNLKEVLKELGKRGIVSLLVEGGQKINSSFLKGELVDNVVFFVSKKKVGKGLFFVDESVKKIELEGAESEGIGKDLLISGKVK